MGCIIVSAMLCGCGRPKGDPEAADQSAVANRPAPELAWPAGKRLVFDVTLETKVAFSSAPAGTIRLSGKLGVEQRAVANGTEFAFDSHGLHFDPAPGTEPAEFADLNRQLAAANYSFITQNGRIVAHRGPASLNVVVRNTLLSLASQFQFSTAADPTTGELEGLDSSGRFFYKYDPSKGDVRKRHKLRYGELFLGVENQARVRAKPNLNVEESRIEIQFDSVSLVSLISHEVVGSPLNQGAAMRGVTDISLKRVAESPSSLDLNARAALSAELPFQSFEPGQREQEFDVRRIGNFTFDSAIEQLVKLEKDEKKDDFVGSKNGVPIDPSLSAQKKQRLAQHQEAFGALVAILRTQPDTVESASAYVKKRKPAFHVVLDALGSAGEPATQKVVADLARDPKSKVEDRSVAALALGQLERATKDSILALDSLVAHPQLTQFGSFGLGSVARRLALAGDTELADLAFSSLAAHLSSAKTVEARSALLSALSNTANPKVVPLALPYLSDANPALLRHAALQALRQVDTPEATAAVAHALRSDDFSDRRIALESIEERKPSPELIQAVVELAETSKRSHERLTSVDRLAKWAPEHPELRTVLQRIAQKDERELIRSAAQKAL